MKSWTTSCPDWEKRIVNQESLITFDPLFPNEADQALSILNELILVDVLGKPTMREASRQWVIDFVSAIFGSYDSDAGRRLITESFLLISKKNGKALAMDTPIPTPEGWSTMGDLQIGDMVFGTNGKPCTITKTSSVYHDHQCYRVDFSNGESVIADAEHLWETNALQDRPGSGQGNDRKSKRLVRVRTTKEIAQTLFRNDGARNHSVKMPSPIDLPDLDLPIQPYTLGAWLGDGHNAAARITCADEEIMQRIEADGFLLGRRTLRKQGKAWSQTIGIVDRSKCIRGHDPSRMKPDGRCLDCEKETDHYRRNGTPTSPIIRKSLTTQLKELNLLNNKHIPKKYFRASFDQRLCLLQGLMDTDGTISKSGMAIGFTSISEKLASDVGSLLSTLGVKYSLTSRKMTCNGNPVEGLAWQIQFMAFRDELLVFTLNRKLERMRYRYYCNNAPRSQTVQITNVECVQSVPVKCIMVDSHDHQFIFGRTMLPTHNSTDAAAIMLTALIHNWRDSAEFLILAPTVEVANNSFLPARDMVKADKDLSDLLHVQDHYRQITHRETGAILKVVAADSETVGGKKATGVLIDELWIMGKRNNAENMLREATGGLASRPEGFVIYLSTQSDEAPAGIFKQKLDYARGVRDGRINDNKFLPVIYEFPQSYLDEKKHLDPKNFYITNPNLGASVDEEFILREFEKAKEAGHESMQGFLAKHLNVEMGLSLKEMRWVGADFWENAAGKITLEDIFAGCEVITIGIDGGGLDDLLGLAVIGRIKDSQDWLLWNRAWMHPIALERRKSEASKYHDFAKDGDLIIVKEIGQDIKQVGDIVMQCENSGLLDRIGIDPIAIGDIVDEIESRDLPKINPNAKEHDRIVGIPQGWRLSGAIKTTERRLAGKETQKLTHAGQSLMTWCVGNARCEVRGNNLYITKQASGTAKIDPLMATFDAIALMAMNPLARSGSVSDEYYTII